MATREYRFQGVTAGGQSVQGTVMASSKRKAREKVEDLSEEHGFKPSDLKKRRTYYYKVRHPNGTVKTGEQKAFSAEEVEEALGNMGLEVVKVQKKWFDFEFSPPQDDLIMFVRLAANLLRENLPFDEVLEMLVNDVSSKSLQQVIRDLNSDLKGGMNAEKAFNKHRDKLGKFTAYMLGIASKSGNMAEIYEATARFLERKDEFSSRVRSAMIMPAVTTVAMIGAMVWYIWYIVPATAGLFEGMDVTMPPLTSFSLGMAAWLDQYWVWVLIGTVGPLLAFVVWARTEQGKFYLHKYMIKVPLIGKLLHKINIEIFCRVFSILYSGAGDNLRVIRIAAEACGNKYMEYRIRNVTIPMMTAQGASLVQALKASGVFTSMAITRFKSGAETGSVRESARQMADYYEQETELSLDAAVESIQTGVSIIIAIGVLFLTILSAEMAFIQPSQADMMGM
ncbi:type II secretion system F family protein [Salinibacter ruber]|uniref:Type IV pilus assembly protein PilC n=1 Tax=Salinibacter ruber TaxID=146919 RepID=A0A9X2ZX07_9BACT|nr:type II secretion system F family protein [Salinibacter ruber]MBB4089102.1 type IV pilus assembly protein PilC [Salinibacter ruber]MCS3610721.1 type IV pilus assembly protein PilC [Salinibacter ruber]MCS3613964.1 type IV pilus assembly protein PilC [Salinibacter ruber]MCS3647149.1 type IV pilus assembly protein PilC [Salinibacter ruber]MCS3674238.1 type IV pilus assembly protein PilC [Salinibacter ruber]